MRTARNQPSQGYIPANYITDHQFCQCDQNRTTSASPPPSPDHAFPQPGRQARGGARTNSTSKAKMDSAHLSGDQLRQKNVSSMSTCPAALIPHLSCHTAPHQRLYSDPHHHTMTMRRLHSTKVYGYVPSRPPCFSLTSHCAKFLSRAALAAGRVCGHRGEKGVILVNR